MDFGVLDESPGYRSKASDYVEYGESALHCRFFLLVDLDMQNGLCWQCTVAYDGSLNT